jgi:hypothetical protein
MYDCPEQTEVLQNSKAGTRKKGTGWMELRFIGFYWLYRAPPLNLSFQFESYGSKDEDH